MSYVIATLSRFDDLLAALLDSLRAAGETSLVAVADDGLSDPGYFRRRFPPLEIVPGPRSDYVDRDGTLRRNVFVFSRSANMLLRRYAEQDVFLVNDDVRLVSGSIRSLERTAAAPNVGVVSPAIDSSACRHESQLSNAQLRFMRRPPRPVVRDVGDEAFYFSAVYLSARTRARAGLLDEDPHVNEDVRYCQDVRKVGLRNVVDGRCVIWHLGGASRARLEGQA